MLDPFIKHKVDHKQFVIHIAGGNCEAQKFMVEDIGSALFTEDVAVYFELLVLKADLEL